MKCPRQINYRIDQGFYNVVDMGECLKEECAWWESNGGGCALPLLALRLGTLVDAIYEIKEKMPVAKE